MSGNRCSPEKNRSIMVVSDHNRPVCLFINILCRPKALLQLPDQRLPASEELKVSRQIPSQMMS